MADKQCDLRDELCAVIMAYLERGDVDLVKASAAAFGACAVALGALPAARRKIVADVLASGLLDHANMRAAEIERGVAPAPIAQAEQEASRHG